MDNKITVRLNIFHDYPMYAGPLTPYAWGAWLRDKLIAAGIPARSDGTLEHGTITRRDDPETWGVTIYEWTPDA